MTLSMSPNGPSRTNQSTSPMSGVRPLAAVTAALLRRRQLTPRTFPSGPSPRSTPVRGATYARFLGRRYQIADQAVDFAAFFHVRQVTRAFEQVNGHTDWQALGMTGRDDAVRT